MILKRINFPSALLVSNIYDFGDYDIIKVSGIATELEFSNTEIIGILKLIISKWEDEDYERLFFKETSKEGLVGKMSDKNRLNHFCDVFSYAYDKDMVNRTSSKRYPLPNSVFRDAFEDLFIKLNKYQRDFEMNNFTNSFKLLILIKL